MRRRARRTLVLGLDCASPELWLDRWRSQLPSFSALLQGASYGPLRSIHPPITVPAWAAMMSGRDPGELGIYGFRGRRSRRDRQSTIGDSSALVHPLLWDLFGSAGMGCVVVGFPPSYPPRPVPGRAVSGMLTPSGASDWTWPHGLCTQVERLAGGPGRYVFDSDAHRGRDPERLLHQVRQMTRTRFRVLRGLLREGDWSLAFLHEIGLDRLQHALWHGLDDPDSQAHADLLAYHRLIDDELGETLEQVGPDCQVLVVSDHGARRFEGVFRINEWLCREGWLARDSSGEIDWRHTRAIADGGYCGRIYLNVEGRDPEGALPADDYACAREALREELEDLRGADGQPLASSAYLPEEVYARVNGIAPDLLFYPGDLALRCAEGFSDAGLFAPGNDTGHDTANHAWDGLFALRDPSRDGKGRVEGAHLLDVAPTLCERAGLGVAGWMTGAVIG